MKNVVLKRIFASTLAGALALTLPLTAMAAGAGEGGTEGEASLAGGHDDFFSVVLPTNTASNVNFTLDPKGMIAGGQVLGLDSKKYQPDTKLYFSRINYKDLKMGSQGYFANYYWGSVENAPKSEDGKTTLQFGNTSNWMTITNKSASPVKVELTVNWSNTQKVAIEPDKNKALDAKNEKATIWMEVQASEGRTDDYFNYQQKANEANMGGLNYKYNETDASDSHKVVGLQTLDKVYTPDASDDKKLLVQKMPVSTQPEGTSTVITWVIPTINQGYVAAENASTVKYRAIDKVIENVPQELQAYYLRAYFNKPAVTTDDSQEVSGFETWNNRAQTYKSAYQPAYQQGGQELEGDKSNMSTVQPFSITNPFKGYDESINIYPTYGFRLKGEINDKGWNGLKAEDMPSISLSWKVTIGEPVEGDKPTPHSPVVYDGLSTSDDKIVDIVGVIDDTQFYKVLPDTMELTAIKVQDYIKTTEKDKDGNWIYTPNYYKEPHVLWTKAGGSEKVNTDGFLDAGVLDMVTVNDFYKTVDNKKVIDHYDAKINLIMLMNYSQAKFFKDDGEVRLTFVFGEGKDAISRVVKLKDSMNNVQ